MACPERSGVMAENDVNVLGQGGDPHALESELERLQKLVAALSDVVHGLGHDLREPIRLLNCYIDLLKKRTALEEDQHAKVYLYEISTAARRLDEFVNGILEYACLIGEKGPPFRPVDMNGVLQSALANLQMQIEQNRATIVYDELPEIVGDSAQLTQLMQNLIGNAIKYRGVEPPEIVVKAEPANTRWRFTVHDNGAGIEQEYFNRIFSPFSRLHGREVSGVGLGLAICRSIVERHGGRIWIASSSKEGSTFVFELPAAESLHEERFAEAKLA